MSQSNDNGIEPPAKPRAKRIPIRFGGGDDGTAALSVKDYYRIKIYYVIIRKKKQKVFSKKYSPYAVTSPTEFSNPYRPARPAICLICGIGTYTISFPSYFFTVSNTIRRILLEFQKLKLNPMDYVCHLQSKEES